MEDDGVLGGFVGFDVPGFVNGEAGGGVAHNNAGLALALAAGNPEMVAGVDIVWPVLDFVGEGVGFGGTDDAGGFRRGRGGVFEQIGKIGVFDGKVG